MSMRLSGRILFLAWILSISASASIYNATPANYKTLLPALRPGDVLNLTAGTYPRLYVSGLRGLPGAWITIAGPASGAPAMVVGDACCNTVEIVDSSYLAIQNLTIDSLGIDGVAGVSAKSGIVHDILIQNNTLVGQNATQQTNGISTKLPTWGWIIRNNTIIGAGTGMYLGNSDGTDPFVAGLIENNLIKDTIGYNMQIKWQLPRPTVAGMPVSRSITVIRNNVFIKNDQLSPDGDRPNVLLGGFPDSGAGVDDMYEVYGNFFYHNPREALFQASGRVSLHDNVFVDGNRGAAVLQNHDLPLKLAYVYNNTVYTNNRGIYFGSIPPTDHAVVANLIFAGTPISGPITNSSSNLTDSFANAGLYVNAPSFTLGVMDLYPLAGKARGAAFDVSKFTADPDYTLDFNGTSKLAFNQAFAFRGAYAGEGVNPGWRLQASIKNAGAAPTPFLTSLACSPAALFSGQQSACTVSLNTAASTAATVAIVSGNAAVTVPSTVTIPAGATFTSFSAVAGTINNSGSATISATLSGTTAAVTATLTLTPPAPVGALAGAVSTPTGTVNLTAEGSSDWAHWGQSAAVMFDRKASGGQQISNYAVVGGGGASPFSPNPIGFTWTDGTPTPAVTNTATGVYIAGQNKGFRLSAPADTTPRTLKVYVGVWHAQGRMTAQLSDGSAAAYTDSSLSIGSFDTKLGVYAFTYRAGSAGQTLTVTFTQATTGSGNITLQAATLSDGSASGGMLTGAVATPAGPVQLPAEGPVDWAHWGLSSTAIFNHKAGVTQQIGNYTVIGTSNATAFHDSPVGFSWTGGTPTASATNATSGVSISGPSKGFRITAPADTTTRTLKVYVGVWRAQGRMTAQLSDGSAPVYADTSLTFSSVTKLGVYTFTYRAASAGQTLTLTFTQASGGGNVMLEAAALQ